MFRPRFSVLVLLLCLPLTVFAWSTDGHKVVCEIAYQHMTPKTRHAALRLLDSVPQQHKALVTRAEELLFRDGCVWADRIRDLEFYDRFSPWHYINMERSDRQVNTDGCDRGCVLTAVEYHSELVTDVSLPPWQRAQALMFLSHWVGDLHQPLHVSFGDDRGGNLLTVSGFEDCQNLHGVWDYCLLALATDDAMALAALISRDTTDEQKRQWQAGSYQEWAQESFDLARQVQTAYCRDTATQCLTPGDGVLKLPDDYHAVNWPIARERMHQAGIRLAHVLNRLLGS